MPTEYLLMGVITRQESNEIQGGLHASEDFHDGCVFAGLLFFLNSSHPGAERIVDF